MVDNIERVLERGEKIELLVDKTDNLRFQVGSTIKLQPPVAHNTTLLNSCAVQSQSALLESGAQLVVVERLCLFSLPQKLNEPGLPAALLHSFNIV